ncbi:MAG: TIGR04086 family membrane protein [Lachnospiraceae bacterium]|jgi:putative membrane protein (TIGR04086 family)|nr:TIGR04086 family membrane protein [Lachnospiraceae bacterium]
MEKKIIDSGLVVFVMKCMLAAYILTAGLLLLLALMLYRFGLSEKTVSICIIVIYIAVTFLAGFIAGKRAGEKKFLWGLAMGCIYFLILTAVSLIVNKGMDDTMGNLVTVFMLCGGSGMLGGMIS